MFAWHVQNLSLIPSLIKEVEKEAKRKVFIYLAARSQMPASTEYIRPIRHENIFNIIIFVGTAKQNVVLLNVYLIKNKLLKIERK